MKQTILSMLLVFLVAACASQGQRGAESEARSLAQRQAEQAQILREEALKREREEQERQQRGEAPVIRPMTENQVTGGQSLGDSSVAGKEPVDLLSQRAIYYDFDRYDIKDEFIPMIEAHARFLVKNPQFRIDVQGNCDSRGSREYNVALGQRRANNVKRALVALGVSERQIQAISFGAEKPVALGQNEKAWAKNRRSDVVYGTAPRQ
jgi:peptidoglycan-associated lipoprotein